MPWVRPDSIEIKHGQTVRYTNTGQHAIHSPGIKKYLGRLTKFGWFTEKDTKVDKRMDKPQFVWVDEVEPPKPSTTWRHHNGNEYGVLLITNEGSQRPEYPPTVVYVNKVSGKWYSRPVADWHRSMTEVPDDGE